MFFKIFFQILIVEGNNGIWSKCSKPCSTGEQINLENDSKRFCNFEKCDQTYQDENLLKDGYMENTGTKPFIHPIRMD